jgi:hypothetical protein
MPYQIVVAAQRRPMYQHSVVLQAEKAQYNPKSADETA